MAFPLNTTTQEMLNALANKTHLTKGAMKLYVRERGQGGRSLVFSPGIMFGLSNSNPFADRLLLPSEKPVTIQLRRFLQAGYNESDNLEELGRENFAMLCRFIYQPPVLPVIGPVSLPI
jgi:adenylate cyclase